MHHLLKSLWKMQIAWFVLYYASCFSKFYDGTELFTFWNETAFIKQHLQEMFWGIFAFCRYTVYNTYCWKLILKRLNVCHMQPLQHVPLSSVARFTFLSNRLIFVIFGGNISLRILRFDCHWLKGKLYC